MAGLHSRHYEDLKNSGLSDDTIQKAGIKSVPPSEISKLLGFCHHNLSSAYFIPYPHTSGFFRLRCFYEGTQRAKYLQRKNTGNHLYIPPTLSGAVLQDANVPLYITEGEKKSLKAVQEGLPCVAVAGLWSWSNGNGDLISDFELINLKNRRVIIVPDNDWKKPNRHGYAKNLELAVQRLAEKLIERGAEVFIKHLPKSNVKIGLDDYMLEHNVAEFLLLPETKIEKFTEISKEDPLLKWNEILNMNIATEWLLDKLIPEGGISLLFGKGGIGKTSLALQIIYAIAEGLDFAGLKTKRAMVVYIDLENPLTVLKDKISKIGQTADVFIWHGSCNPSPPRLDSKDWELYLKLPKGLLVFDTLRASFMGDENDSQDIAIVIDRLKQLRDRGFTILLLHHTPKGNDSIYKGSTAILDLVDNCLGLELASDKGEESIEFDCDNLYKFGTRIKTRYQPHCVFLRFNPEIKGFEIACDPDIETLEAIYEILKDKGEFNTNQLFEIVKKELDVKSKGQFLKLLKKGENRYWTHEKRGRAVFYSPTVQAIYSGTDGPNSINQTEKASLIKLSSLEVIE